MNARRLRRNLTEPEKRLWWHLRHRLPQEGTHFRRQVAIGPYVADFCCLGRKLIVEVDGGQHTTDEAIAYDRRRTAHMKAQGFRVLRFGNGEVMREIDAVLDTIFAALQERAALHPASTSPPPCGEGEGGGGGSAWTDVPGHRQERRGPREF